MKPRTESADAAKIQPCRTCLNRWLGNADKALNWAIWYCRKEPEVRRKDMPVIGSDAELKAAKGCGEWKK